MTVKRNLKLCLFQLGVCRYTGKGYMSAMCLIVHRMVQFILSHWCIGLV